MPNRFKKIVSHLQGDIDQTIDELLARIGEQRHGILGYVVNQTRGHAVYSENAFTVPYWAYMRGNGYFTYYVAHELAHLLNNRSDDFQPYHKAKFYKHFREVCPEGYWHHEFEYIKSSRRYLQRAQNITHGQARPKAHQTKKLIEFIISD